MNTNESTSLNYLELCMQSKVSSLTAFCAFLKDSKGNVLSGELKFKAMSRHQRLPLPVGEGVKP